jgi:TonB-dependent receptor
MNSHKNTLCALALAFCMVGSAIAADSGSIAGTVSNTETKTLLNEARIAIPSQRLMTLTDSEGRFAFRDLAPGAYELEVSYIGLDTALLNVEVVAGQEKTVHVGLTSDIYILEKFVISGEREGNAASITRQKYSPNVKNVIALDAYGNMPNNSVGELLMRIPGIAGRAEDSGEVTGNVIRGAAPGLNTVSVDGNLQASIGGLGREFRTNMLSGALFEEIEVIKAPTPDMPADSLGGAVNLKTRSALSMKEKRRFNYRAAWRTAPSFYDHTPRRRDHANQPLLSFGYQEVFDAFGGEHNLGISLNAFYSENVYSNDQVIQDYQYTTSSPAYVWDYRTVDLYNNRKQSSGNLRLDMQLSKTTQVYIGGIYNDAFEPFQSNYQMRAYTGRNAANFEPGYTDTFTAVVSNTAAMVELNSTMYGFNARERQINTGATHKLDRLKIDYDIFYNHSNANLTNGRRGSVHGGGIFTMNIRNIGWTIDKSGSLQYPEFTQTAGNSIYDGANYSNGSITVRDSKRNTRVYGGKANAIYALPFKIPSTIKGGLFFRSQMVEEVRNEHIWKYIGADSLARLVDPDIVTRDSLRTGKSYPFINSSAIVDDMENHPAWWQENGVYDTMSANLTGTRGAEEKITAGYFQWQTRFQRFNVLAGLRYEHTSVYSRGYVLLPASERTTTAERQADPVGSVIKDAPYRGMTGNYDKFFPGIHFIYHMTKNLQARLSWSNGVGRPTFTQLLPSYSANTTSETITINNPSLKPQLARNLDFAVEYYFEPVGQLGLGLFRKDITDYIVTNRGGTVENGMFGGLYVGNEYDGWAVNTNFNASYAVVEGIELNYQQQLTMLPGFLRGLGVYANYTLLRTRGEYGETGARSTRDVANFYPRTANAGLTYKYHKISVSASVNYTGEFLANYSNDLSRLRYRNIRRMVNFSFSYAILKSLELSVDIQNAFNEPNAYYRLPDRSERITTAGTSVVLGVSGRF